MAKGVEAQTGLWVLLCYRLPREPSTPRITVWRNLRRLGVGQLADGLVTLPADARTREQLEWIAHQINEFGGEASIWLAHPATLIQEEQVGAGMSAARASEYQAVINDAAGAADLDERDRRRLASRLSAELQRIGRRDYFPPPERDRAEAAVDALRAPSDTGTASRKATR